jgi:hypothetical protein
MKSIILSDQMKEIVFKTVEKALIECASQHDAHAESYTGNNGEMIEPSSQMIEFANSSPDQLKLTFLFRWPLKEGQTKPVEMHCQPIIDLTNLGKEIK